MNEANIEISYLGSGHYRVSINDHVMTLEKSQVRMMIQTLDNGVYQ